MPSEPIRVGLLGAGAVAQVAHIPAYGRLRNADLVAICDQESPKLRALQERTGVEHAVSSIEELLSIEELDAIDVCLPNHLHADAVIRCLEAGKHVLCERPLAPTAAEVSSIIEAQKSTGRRVLVGMKDRFRDDSILLKRFVENGALGDVFYARGGWWKRRDQARHDSWHYKRSEAGGGVLLDLGIQLIDLALWLCGYPDPERVDASCYHHNPAIDVEDTAVVALHCSEGITITLEFSWMFHREEKLSLALFGTEGSGLLNPIRVFQPMHGDLVDVAPRSSSRRRSLYIETYEREIAFFAEVVGGRQEPPALGDYLTLARVVEAIRLSASERSEVRLGGGSEPNPSGSDDS